MCSNILKEQGFRELEEFIDKLETKEGSLIAVLHKAQNIFGYLPKEVQEFIEENRSQIQCIVAKPELNLESVEFGEAQFPKLDDYADNVNTMRLLEVI